MVTAVSAPDPFKLNVSDGDFNYSAGRILMDARNVLAGSKPVLLIYSGDSLHGSTDGSAYTPSNLASVFNLCLGNGGLYQGSTPALGCAYELSPSINGFHGFRTADKLINATTYDRVVVAPISIGSTSTTDWAPGGFCSYRIQRLNARLNSIGLLGLKTYWLHDSGIQDALGTVSQATVQANLNAFIATIRGLSGWSAISILISQSSTLGNGALTSSSNVAAAQSAILSPTNANVFAGATTDDMIPATYRYDGSHMNATGSDLMASREVTQIGLHP